MRRCFLRTAARTSGESVKGSAACGRFGHGRAVLLLALLLVVAALVTTPARAAPPTAPEISARAAVVIDDDTGQVLYAHNAQVLLPPASLTKIVTAVVVLEHTYLNQPVRVRADWDELYDSSIMGLTAGEVLTVEELLYGLMLPSGNDAALALARAVAGSEAAFVRLMNAKMRWLGLAGSHFSNSHGLHDDSHDTTAYEIATVARYGLRNPVFAKIVATPQLTVHSRGVYPLRNTNRLLRSYRGAYGVKTGYTEEALMTLVAAAERDGRRLVTAILGSTNTFADAQQLFDYAFDGGLVLAHSAAAPHARLTGFGPPRMFSPWQTPEWPPWWATAHDRHAFEIEFALLQRTARAARIER